MLHAPDLQDPQQRLPDLVIGRRCAGRYSQVERPLWHPVGDDLPDVDVAAAGGWKDTQSNKSAYQQADAETIVTCRIGGR